MIAAWMLYAAAAAALLALAAAGLDRALRLLGRPARWVWAAALLLSCAVPVAAWRLAVAGLAPVAEAAVTSAAADAATAAGGVSLDELLARATIVVEPGAWWAALDRPLLAGWLLLTAALAFWCLLAQLRLRRVRREWRPAVVERAPVLVSGRTGPAVAGVLRTSVVLPEWALAADPALLRLMLAHEQEHVRAGDPRLLAAAATAVALMPWNPALWWQWHRLRLAVEIDCDGRVLRRHPDVHRYGRLLLEVGRLSTRGERLPLAAFTAPGSSLERRIRSMTMPTPRHPLLQGAALAGAAALLVLAACEVPPPTAVSAPENEVPLGSIRSTTAALAPARGVSVEQVRAVVQRTMPELLARSSGERVDLWVVADAAGQVLRVERPRLRRRALTAATAEDAATRERETVTFQRAQTELTAGIEPAAIASVEVMRLAPGRVTVDSASVVWVQLKPGAVLEKEVAAPGGRVRLRQAAPAPDAPAATRADEEVPVHGTLRLRQAAPAGESRPRVALGTGDGPQPLFLIDGVRVASDDRRLRELAPDSIDSIEVVKGAVAERLYGAEGRNGVVRITTRAAAGARKPGGQP